MSFQVVGMLLVVLGIIVSIALHEIGHLVPAKRFGVRCTQYMIGFGPTLWSVRRGGTEYGIKAIPLGGYVRMLGMFPPRRELARHHGGPASGAVPAPEPGVAGADTDPGPGRWASLIEQARHDSYREVRPEDADRLFYQRSVGRRMVIMLGGPVMNLSLAVGLIGLIVMGYGVGERTTLLSSVSQCVIPADAPADRTCTPTDPLAPAAAAGLRPGDRIVAFDGRQVRDWDVVRSGIRASGARPVRLGVERDGVRREVTVTPIVSPREVLDENGERRLGTDGRPVLERVGFLGVTPSIELVRQPATAVPGLVADQLGATAGVMVQIPQKMVGVAEAVFGGGERELDGPLSIVGAVRVGGEVAAAGGTDERPVTPADRLFRVLSVIAAINLALFVFNMVPLLPLDGGHMAAAVWEAVKRGWARLRNRPDPGPVDVARALPLAYGVASVLIGMSVLLIYADIVRPIRLVG